MKKIIGFIMLVLCVCITAVCYAQESAEIPYEEFIGGMSREGAKRIPEAKYGRLLKGNIKSGKSAWYIFEAEESGDLLLDVNVFNDNFGFGVSLKFFEEESESSIEWQIIEDRYTFVYSVTKGKQYCFEIERVWNGEADYSISLCFDGYHMPVTEGEIARNATCAREGEVTYACLLCSYTAKIEKLPKLPHTLGEWVNKAQPTCTRDGLDVLPCAVCGETIENKTIPATGHGEIKAVVTKEPTCTQKGICAQKCVVCSETVQSEEIPALGHGREETVLLLQPTCTDKGERGQKCTVCGEMISSMEIPALGHTQTTTVVAEEATCLRAGTLETKCVICQDVLSTESIPRREEHRPGRVAVVRKATCTTNGRGEQRCLDCNALLKEETMAAYGHSFSEWTLISEPTKEKEGENARYCTYCAYIEYQKIEKLPKVLGIF